MRFHVIQHVPFEGPGKIAHFATSRGWTIKTTKLFEGDGFPKHEEYDLLVIMGGPMGAHDEGKFPWLAGEKRYLNEAIEKGKKLLGICLGAQLLADVLGARVYRNEQKEIGWFPIELTDEGKESPLFRDFPRRFTPFHWHGDTFEIPRGAVHIARSEACENQAFAFEERVIGLQFHLEMTEAGIDAILANCEKDVTEAPFVQSPERMMELCPTHVEESIRLLDNLLKRLLGVD